MSVDDRTPAPLTWTSRHALDWYRWRASECRKERRKGSAAEADRWDALADELEAFGDQTEHHEGQGELL